MKNVFTLIWNANDYCKKIFSSSSFSEIKIREDHQKTFPVYLHVYFVILITKNFVLLNRRHISFATVK